MMPQEIGLRFRSNSPDSRAPGASRCNCPGRFDEATNEGQPGCNAPNAPGIRGLQIILMLINDLNGFIGLNFAIDGRFAELTTHRA